MDIPLDSNLWEGRAGETGKPSFDSGFKSLTTHDGKQVQVYWHSSKLRNILRYHTFFNLDKDLVFVDEGDAEIVNTSLEASKAKLLPSCVCVGTHVKRTSRCQRTGKFNESGRVTLGGPNVADTPMPLSFELATVGQPVAVTGTVSREKLERAVRHKDSSADQGGYSSQQAPQQVDVTREGSSSHQTTPLCLLKKQDQASDWECDVCGENETACQSRDRWRCCEENCTLHKNNDYDVCGVCMIETLNRLDYFHGFEGVIIGHIVAVSEVGFHQFAQVSWDGSTLDDGYLYRVDRDLMIPPRAVRVQWSDGDHQWHDCTQDLYVEDASDIERGNAQAKHCEDIDSKHPLVRRHAQTDGLKVLQSTLCIRTMKAGSVPYSTFGTIVNRRDEDDYVTVTWGDEKAEDVNEFAYMLGEDLVYADPARSVIDEQVIDAIYWLMQNQGTQWGWLAEVGMKVRRTPHCTIGVDLTQVGRIVGFCEEAQRACMVWKKLPATGEIEAGRRITDGEHVGKVAAKVDEDDINVKVSWNNSKKTVVDVERAKLSQIVEGPVPKGSKAAVKVAWSNNCRSILIKKKVNFEEDGYGITFTNQNSVVTVGSIDNTCQWGELKEGDIIKSINGYPLRKVASTNEMPIQTWIDEWLSATNAPHLLLEVAQIEEVTLLRDIDKQAKTVSTLPLFEPRDKTQAVIVKHCEQTGDFKALREGDVVTGISSTSGGMIMLQGLATNDIRAKLKEGIRAEKPLKLTIIRTQDHGDNDDDYDRTNPFSSENVVYSCDYDLVPAFKVCQTKEMLSRLNTEFNVPEHAFREGLLVRRSAAALLDYSSQHHKQSNGYFQLGKISTSIASTAGNEALIMSQLQPGAGRGISSYYGLFWDVKNSSMNATVNVDAIIAAAEDNSATGKLYVCEGSFSGKENTASEWTEVCGAVTLKARAPVTTELNTPVQINAGTTRGFYLHSSENNEAVAFVGSGSVEWASSLENVTVIPGNVTKSSTPFTSVHSDKKQLAGGLKMSIQENLSVKWSTGLHKCTFSRQIILPMSTTARTAFGFTHDKWRITTIKRGSIAYTTSLRVGDQIMQVRSHFAGTPDVFYAFAHQLQVSDDSISGVPVAGPLLILLGDAMLLCSAFNR